IFTIAFIILGFNSIFAQKSEINKKKVLYNGIVLPEIWPPRNGVWHKRHSMSIPYLKNPPSVIPINIGRQLFIDDFLIDSTNLKRVNHRPKYYSSNPVLKATKKWEYNTKGPYAAPFSDGIWYDEKHGIYKMWYLTGGGISKGKMSSSMSNSRKSEYMGDEKTEDRPTLRTAYAESKDGIHWQKPILNIYGKNNIVDPPNWDASTVWLDRGEQDPSKRYKMFIVEDSPHIGR